MGGFLYKKLPKILFSGGGKVVQKPPKKPRLYYKKIEGKKKFMYRKDGQGWLKHADFIALDLICLQLAYALSYGIAGSG